MGRGIVIVGGGHGGSQVGFSLRQEGYDGPIHLVAEETDLPYHKPPLSKAFLKDPLQEPQVLRAERAYADNGISLVLGRRVEEIDRHARMLRLAGGGKLSYDRLVLATGAINRRLALPGHDLAGIHSIRTLSDAVALRQDMVPAEDIVVIGGGFIGLEAAASFAALGKRVTVVEMAPAILGRAVSPIMSNHIASRYRKLGIRILTATATEALDGEGGRIRGIRLASGERIAADLLLVGIGAVPNDGIAREAGLLCDQGIVVDEMLRTSDTAIFAIGDVANFPQIHAGQRLRLESVQNASDQAKHVAKAIAGKAPGAYRDVPWFWSDQGPMKLQMAGLSIGADRQLRSGHEEDGTFSVYHFSGARLIAVDSLDRPGDHMLARRMLASGFNPRDSDILLGPEDMKAQFSDWAGSTVQRAGR